MGHRRVHCAVSLRAMVVPGTITRNHTDALLRNLDLDHVLS